MAQSKIERPVGEEKACGNSLNQGGLLPTPFIYERATVLRGNDREKILPTININKLSLTK